MLTYDNINTTLKVYALKKDCEIVGKFCSDVIEKQKEQDLQFETFIEVSNSKLRVEISKGVESKKDLIGFICKESGIEERHIKHCGAFHKRKIGNSYANLTFINKDIAERVKKVASLVKVEKYQDNNNSKYYLKISHNGQLSQKKVEEQLRAYSIIPLGIKNLCDKFKFSIIIRNFLPELSQSQI